MAPVVAERNLGAPFQELLLWKHLHTGTERHTGNSSHKTPWQLKDAQRPVAEVILARGRSYAGPWPIMLARGRCEARGQR